MADDLDKRIKQIADMFGVTDTQSLKILLRTYQLLRNLPWQRRYSAGTEFIP